MSQKSKPPPTLPHIPHISQFQWRPQQSRWAVAIVFYLFFCLLIGHQREIDSRSTLWLFLVVWF